MNTAAVQDTECDMEQRQEASLPPRDPLYLLRTRRNGQKGDIGSHHKPADGRFNTCESVDMDSKGIEPTRTYQSVSSQLQAGITNSHTCVVWYGVFGDLIGFTVHVSQ